MDKCYLYLAQFDLVLGRFNPKNVETLRPEYRQHIGKVFTYEVVWVIEEGTYAGQLALLNYSDKTQLHWFPSCDIDILLH